MNCIKCGRTISNGQSAFNGKCYLCDIEDNIERQPFVVINNKQKILLIEEGSVDTKQLDGFSINYIVYKKGKKPEIIEI